MRQFVIRFGNKLGLLVLLASSVNVVFSQQSSVASLRNANGSFPPKAFAPSELAEPSEQATILARFVAAETKVREALNQHTFRRDAVLQTIGPNGEVTGEYLRNSQFIFDDRGRRIERVLFHPASTIREMRITKEDIQDLEGSQLLGIDIVEATKYQLSYAGVEAIDGRQLFAVDVTPLVQPDPKHMKDRFFVGRVWIDPTSFQILKIKGVVEPQGKQRFPMFMTWREPIRDALAFPTRTEADDILHFQDRDVHYRIKVRYYDYKEFGSKVTVKDVDENAPALEEAAPKTKESPAKLEPSLKINEASGSRSVPTVRPMNEEVCTTNRNSPPVGAYHWPVDTDVKVYFVRNMFTFEQSAVLLEALRTWNIAGQENGSGVNFVYAGEADSRANCRNCLTVTRRDVFARDKHHYAFFHPMNQEEGRLLVSAWIDLDIGITEPKALQGFMAHELGHGLGLWDCPTCKKKQSLMNSFPGLNKNNGRVAPSSCDLATMKSVYQDERQIASARSNKDQQPGAVGSSSTLTVPATQRSLVGGAAATRFSSDQRPEPALVNRTLGLSPPAPIKASY
jgi:hypothetical protein